MTLDTRPPSRASRLARAAIVLAFGGIAAIAVFGAMTYVGAVWSFMAMDNPPPDRPYQVLWDLGRVGLLAGVVAFAIGVVLAVLTRLATSAARRHAPPPRGE
jgi:hypothetical protein